MAVIGEWRGPGRVLLETDELIFRGPNRLVVARDRIHSARADDGWLEITHAGGRARFEVGGSAARWAHDILHPKTRIEKMDVGPHSNVAALSIRDAGFLTELRATTPHVSTRLGRGPYDIVFYKTDRPSGLGRLTDLRERIVENGAVWIITPKGLPAIGHGPVVAAAKAAGLTDVKSARFSATHTALKLMVPRAKRRR